MQFTHFQSLFSVLAVLFFPTLNAENATYTCYACIATTKNSESSDSSHCLKVDPEKTTKDDGCLWCTEMYERKLLGTPDEFYNYERRCVKNQKLLPTMYNCAFAPSNTEESRGFCWCVGNLCNNLLNHGAFLETTTTDVPSSSNALILNSLSFVICLNLIV